MKVKLTTINKYNYTLIHYTVYRCSMVVLSEKKIQRTPVCFEGRVAPTGHCVLLVRSSGQDGTDHVPFSVSQSIMIGAD